jgi:trypsin-like peptidase
MYRYELSQWGKSSEMARIPDDLTYGISFTYRTHADAEDNARHGGTAFLIGKPVEGVGAPDGMFLIYAVTNYHVVYDSNSPVLRLHRRDGKLSILDLKKEDWVPHPDGEDLAIAYISENTDLSDTLQNVKFVTTSQFLTPEIIKSHDIGLGDDVFMVGRFLNHQGTKDALAPAVRQGSICMMTQPLWNSVTNNDAPSFSVEMRSRTGFSGSPVVVYRNSLTAPISAPSVEPGVPPFWWYLLGVNWGYVNEKDTGENTWLNGVVPAWKILELLEEPLLKDLHDAATEKIKKWQRGHGTTTAAATAESGVTALRAGPS